MGYLSKGRELTSAEEAVVEYLEPLGSALQQIRVNAAGTALEYFTAGASLDGSGTLNEIAYWVDSDTLGSLAVATYPSLTELSYVKGVTSAIQTQITAKAPSTSPTFATSITGSYLTASEILITDGSKNIVSAAVATYPSLTELTYLKGVTSAIQTQIGTKAAHATTITIAGTANQITSSAGAQDLSANRTWTLSLPSDVLIPTVLTVPNTGLHLLDTNASHDLIIKPGSDLTADKTLTITTGDADVIVNFTAVTDEYVLAYDITSNTWRGVAAGAGASTALDNLASVAINTTLVSDTYNTDALGTSAIAWSDLFLGSGAVIEWSSAASTPDVTLTHSANTLTIAGGALVAEAITGTTITVNTNLVPDANDGAGLGISGTAFSDLFLATGGVIDWLAGAVTITHSANTLTIAGSAYTTLALGATNITMTGSLAATGARVSSAFFTVLESTTIELGATSDTTISRVSAGVIAVEGVTILTVAGGTMTGNIVLGENTSVDLDPAGSADGKYSGICITGTAGAALAFGDLIYLAVADSRWELCDADALATAGNIMIGMCVLAAGADGNATKILLMGQVRADAKFPALTIGAAVYAGETAGAIQVAIPTGADNVIRVVGFALTADEIYFNPSQDHQTTVA